MALLGLPRSKLLPSAGDTNVGFVYVSVIILVVISYWTSIPSDSATNRSGSIVRPFVMTGTTAGFAASIARVMPFRDACGLSIQRSRESFPSVTVTLRVEDSQATDPPNASMTARIGTSVLPATMTGLVPSGSIGFCTPLTDMDALPIHSLIVVDDKAAPRRMVTRTARRCVLFMSAPPQESATTT